MRSTIKRRDVLIGAAACAAVRSPAAFAASQVHEIEIQSFEFKPAHIEVRPGDTIRWTNRDLAPHTATADEIGWDTGELRLGDIGDVVVTQGMETSYFCAFHPHMKGTIEIVS